MSDKHKIYDYIKRTINPYGRPFEGTAYELGLKIMDYIENMDDEKENGWIPVSERLPEASGTYQVTCMDGRIHRSTYAKFQNKLKRWELTGAGKSQHGNHFQHRIRRAEHGKNNTMPRRGTGKL